MFFYKFVNCRNKLRSVFLCLVLTNAFYIQHFLHSLDEFTHQPPYLTFQRAFSQIQPIAHALEQGKGAKNYHSFLRKCENALNLSGSDEPRLGDSDLNRLQKPDVLTQFTSEQCQLLYQQISIINSCAHDVAQALIKRKVFREHLSNLLLAGRVLKRIHQDQHDGNTFLLAETAQTLVTALGQHDAQFILMKAGIRYQHIMMDEFQDTSTLQWNNFKLLIQEILANGGTALIVGDTKQSIYRWRNGDYEIMNRLHLDPQWQDYFLPHNLSRNFRSQRNIVDFNLSLFDQIRLCNDFASTEVPSMYDESYSPEHLHDFYNDCKQGGYVHYKQFLAPSTSDNETVRNQMLTYMFQQMELLLSLGYQRKDILILCRTSTEAKHVLKLFRHIKADTASYPHLHAAGQIISGDSFLLESSVAVNTIICSLKYLVHQDQVALAYLQLHCPSLHVEALQDLDIHLPFTDLLEQIIRLTLCTDGTYQLQDIAHLNCLRDKIRAYIGQYGSHLESFLQYWDDKMHNDAVPAIESDNIRIMTIHASKGLQAKNVFIPFCAWNKSETSGLLAPTLWCSTSIDDQSMVLPVSYSASMESIPELQAVYQQEKQKQYIDALNLLYVACTRAEDSLYLLYYDAQHTRSAAGSWLRDLFGEEKIVGELMPKQSSSSTTDKIPEPFSFDTAIRQPATYHSNHADIRFRQSQMATQVMRAKALNDSMDNIEFGNLCHAVLEHIQTTDDLEPTLKDFYMRGSIPNQQSMSNIRQLILRLFHHPQAHAWFDGTYQLMREDSVLAYPLHDTTPSIQEFRMDRVMIRHHQAVVLDYKFGKENPEHVLQVQNYMHILHDMGYTDVSGYLWYAFQNNLKQI